MDMSQKKMSLGGIPKFEVEAKKVKFEKDDSRIV